MDNKQQKPPQKDEPIIIEEKISKVNGDIHIKQYQKGKLLGKGGFAKCFEVINMETKRILAAKIIPKASLTKTRARQKLISEIKIHKALHNSNVVQFEHVFEDSENVYILLELCPNQTLNELIKRRRRLHELECQCYVMQIIHALRYLHNTRVIHRDLKLGNLFLGDNMELKLGDFGLATRLEFDGEKKRTICGTPNYIAPEILNDKSGHSYPVDIWSLGVIIYTILIGKPPFETPDVKSTYTKIRMNNYSFPEHVQIGDQARALIVSILLTEPTKRPTIDQIVAHPFLNSCQIPKNLPLSTIACSLSKQYIQQFQNAQTQKMPIKDGKSQDFMQTNPEFSQNKGQTMNKQGQLTLSQTGFKNTQQQGMSTVQSVAGFNKNGQQQVQKASMSGGQGQKHPNSDVWVVQWVDYSTKYGLGYILSNGCCGVYFNDSTKIIMDNKENFDYLQRLDRERQDSVQKYSIQDYPTNLQKKVTLLQHFRSYLEGDRPDTKRDIQQDFDQNQSLIYIKKWMKTRHAIMFRLSNKVVQVNFTDKTEILLSSQNKLVTYVNKQGERTNFQLATALESNNVEMSKRLKYTKEILTHMLDNNKKGKEGTQENQQQQEQMQQQQA